MKKKRTAPRNRIPKSVEALHRKASKAFKNSYSPYSRFAVGAALRKASKIFVGTNVENSSYGGTICAEQSAIVSGVTAGVRSFDEILIVTRLKEGGFPCGRCLQVLQEFMSPEAKIWIATPKKVIRSYRLEELLPQRFEKSAVSKRE